MNRSARTLALGALTSAALLVFAAAQSQVDSAAPAADHAGLAPLLDSEAKQRGVRAAELTVTRFRQAADASSTAGRGVLFYTGSTDRGGRFVGSHVYRVYLTSRTRTQSRERVCEPNEVIRPPFPGPRLGPGRRTEPSRKARGQPPSLAPSLRACDEPKLGASGPFGQSSWHGESTSTSEAPCCFVAAPARKPK